MQRPQLRQLTKEEFETMKQGMHGEFRRLKGEVGPEEAEGDRRKPIVGVVFSQVDRPLYFGEVGLKDGDAYFHFFPSTQTAAISSFYWPEVLGPKIAQVYNKVFPMVEGMWDYCPDVEHPQASESERAAQLSGSIVLRVPGAASNLFIGELCTKLFEELDRALA